MDTSKLDLVARWLHHGEFTEDLYNWLRGLLERRTARALRKRSGNTPPKAELEDIVADFIHVKLIAQNGFAYLHARNADDRGLGIGLRLMLDQFLVERARSEPLGHVFKRVRDVLETFPEFQRLESNSTAGRERWARRGTQSAPIEEADLAPVRARVGQTELSARRERLYDTEVREALATIFESLKGSLTLGGLVHLVAWRLSIDCRLPISLDLPCSDEAIACALDSIADPLAVDSDVKVDARRHAGSIVSRLDARQLAVVREYAGIREEPESPDEHKRGVVSVTLTQVGERLGLGKSTVANVLNSVRQLVDSMDIPSEAVHSTYEALIEIIRPAPTPRTGAYGGATCVSPAAVNAKERDPRPRRKRCGSRWKSSTIVLTHVENVALPELQVSPIVLNGPSQKG